MNVALNPRYEKIVESCAGSGKFASPEAVIEAALDRMIDPLSSVSPTKLNALIDEGVRDLNEGRVLSAEEVDAQLEATRNAFLSR